MREGVQLLALALLALVLRTWQLGDAVRLFVDEVNFSSAVEQFLGEGDLDLIAPRVMSFTGLYTYWQTGGVVMFGRDLTGLRVASVALGTLTVLAVYGLGRMLFDRPTALAAAILLATLPLHIHFSRLGLNNIADPLFGVLAFALFARGLRRGRRMDFALAGAALGLTQYFYEGGRLLYPAVMAAWGVLVYLFAVDGVNAAPAKRRLVRSGLVTTALTALLVAAPVYYTLVALDAPLTSRFGEVGMGSGYWIKLLFPDPGINPWPEQLRRLRDPLLLMISHPERSLFYGGGQPLLLAYLVPPFLLGAALLLWRLRKPGALLLLVWLVGAAVGNSLLVGTMDAARYVVVAPALALVCAVGLVGVLRLVFVTTTPKPHTPPHQTMQRLQPHRYALPLAALAVALFAGGQAVYYFGPHLERYNDQFREFDPLGKGQDAIFRALDFRTGTEIHLISTHEYNEAFANGMLSFLRGTELRAYTHTPDEITPEFLNSLGRNVDHAFFIETGELLALARIRQAFTLEPPRARDYDVRPGDLFVLYYAPAELPGGAP
jgi:4-amino-4-deoxy-L-arabinose transferase-like glycosyltransferase